MKIILGLGNPGTQYERTRHNIGWMVLDELARRHQISIAKRMCDSRVGDGILLEGGASEKILLVKPLTFMNLSGRAAQALLKFYGLEKSDMIVITDDLNLPLGKIRLRAGGSDGGHNGLKSITQSLSSPEWARLRMGVGAPDARERAERGTKDFVLRPFAKDEADEVALCVARAADCAEAWALQGIAPAMNRFNAAP
jgi:PTH1 family peptidyl-tRNA hydrolase